MLKCKQVAEALADHHYDDLPKWKKIGLKLHLALCFVCSKYHKQVLVMQDCARNLSEQEKADKTMPHDQCLSDDCKARMKKALAESNGND